MNARTFPVQPNQTLELIIDQETAVLLNAVNCIDPGTDETRFSVQTQAIVALREGLRIQIQKAEALKR